MDKNGLFIVLLLLFMIVLDRSNALNPRKFLTTSDPNGSSKANQDSPLPSPLPNKKKPNLSPAGATEPKDTPMTNPPDVDSKGLNDTNTKKSSESSSDTKLDNEKSHDDKVKEKNADKSKTIASESCNGNPICSDQKKTMVACIQDFDGSNKLALILQNKRDITMKVNLTFVSSMNNSLSPFEIPGRAIEKVNITFSGDKTTKVILNAGNGDCELQIGALNTTTIDNPSNSKDVKDPADSPSKPKGTNIPADTPTKPKEADNPSKPKEADAPAKPKDVDAPPKSPKDDNDPSKSPKGDNDPSKSPKDGNDPSNSPKDNNDPSKSPKHAYAPPDPTSVDTPISQNNLLNQLSFYSKQVTPIYGAYFAFLVALIIGGSWAFCSFRKRRSEGEVPYQELEMGLPESSNAVDVETAEGWDQDWDDDDWDEDKAIRSPGGGIVQAKTISSNGLTSRATKKDDWDANWDD